MILRRPKTLISSVTLINRQRMPDNYDLNKVQAKAQSSKGAKEIHTPKTEVGKTKLTIIRY